MKREEKYFLIRKIVHLLLGIVFLVLMSILYSSEKSRALLFAGLLLMILLLYDFLRMEFKFQLFKGVVKEKEQFQFHAVTLALAAAIIVFSLFDRGLAFAAVSISVFGDCAASLVGRFIGRHRYRSEKTLEGFFAYLIIGSLVGLLFVPLPFALLMALVAATIELICTHTEDNFVVPIVIAFLGQGLVILVTLLA